LAGWAAARRGHRLFEILSRGDVRGFLRRGRQLPAEAVSGSPGGSKRWILHEETPLNFAGGSERSFLFREQAGSRIRIIQ
jgi:hypothetical protein